MAISTPPILSSLVLESLKRSGYSNPSSELQARATERWLEEIKAELWAKARNLKSLQSKSITVLSKGVNQYSNPSDYASDMTIVFATGSTFGTAQAGASGSITLASSYTGTEADVIAREIVITSGTGVGGIATISSYVPGTKVATVSPSFSTAPTSGSGYMILDDYRSLQEGPIWDHANISVGQDKGYPDTFFPIGDATNGKIILNPTPWRSDSQPMILIHRYQADLTEADAVGTLMLTLYQKWQQLWITGLRWKTLQNDDDDRAVGAFQEYQKSMRDIMNVEIYGNTINELQMKVVDF